MSPRKNIYAPRLAVLICIGVAAFLVAAVAIAPASLVTPFLKGGDANIQYQEVSGTIWKGEFRAVSTGDVFLGDISFKTRPLALLGGAIAADIAARDGAAIGAGRISANLITRRLAVSDVNFAFDLSAIRRYSLFGIPYQGRIEARGAGLVMSRSGCRSATGEVWTDLLDASSRRLVGESLLLAGPATCQAGEVIVTLSGGNREGQTAIKIAIDPAMTYRVMASVDLGRAELENNLRRLGFEDDDGVLVYDAIGALKGAGS